MDQAPTITAKGERTRAKILRAAQEAVGELGVAGVSHRVIAERAGVRLSLTSYYFASLDHLLEAAWDEQRRAGGILSHALGTQAMRLVELFAAPGTEDDAKLMHLDALAELFARYIENEAVQTPLELATDCGFLFAWKLPQSLRDKVVRHNQSWVDRASELMARAGSQDPAADGATLVAAIRFEEFAQVTYAKDARDVAKMKRQFFRLLCGLLIGAN
jgi:AcrR family transcriptional regulator